MTEHVEVVQRLRRIETKLDAALECNEDHEHRLRSVGNKQWGMSGAAAVAQLQDMTELRLITGRQRKPLVKKLNPIWWFQNDDEEQTALGISPSGRSGAGTSTGTSCAIPCRTSAAMSSACKTATILCGAARR